MSHPDDRVPSATEVLDRCTEEAYRRSDLPVAFAGLVRPDQALFSISSLRGTATNSLANLRVRSGEGLGGKALKMRRAAAVRSYLNAQGITRRYDHAVEPERLESIFSVPVAVPGRAPVAVLYLADRAEVGIGDAVTERIRPVLTELAHQLEVALELERRMAALRADYSRARTSELPDLRGDVLALIDSTTDAATRDGLRSLLGKLGAGGAAPGAVPSPLTNREAEVLRHAERGESNLEIAHGLGLSDSTVKSYMKAAMAKLGADNRVRACRAARERGFLD